MNTKVKNIITMLVLMLVVLGLAIGTTLLVKPIKEKNIENTKISRYQIVFEETLTKFGDDKLESDSPSTVTFAKEVYAGSSKAGVAYEATNTNDWGSINLIVGVDGNNIITGIEATVNQSIGKEKTKAYIASFKGSKIDDFKTMDSTSKPTTQDSLDTAEGLLRDIATVHGVEVIVVEDTIYDKLFGKGYRFGEVTEITGYEYVKSVKTVTGDLGSAVVYRLAGLGVAEDDKEEKQLEIDIIIDPFTTKILGHEIDLDKSAHTKSYLRVVDKFIENLVETNMFAAGFDQANIDSESGASAGGKFNSVKLTIKFLENFKEYLNKDQVYTFENTIAINEEKVLSKTNFTIDGESLTLYSITNTGKYNDYSENIGRVTTEVVVNSNNEIINTRFSTYEHTPSKTYKEASDKFIQSLVDNKVIVTEITDFEIDGESGATASGPSNSVFIIRSSFIALGEYIKGGN